MLTLASTWVPAMRRSSTQPVMLVSITIGANTYRAQSADGNANGIVVDYPQSVTSVTPVSSEKDPWTCESSISECEVTFAADGWAKELVVGNRVRGQKVEITMGPAGLVAADFAPYFLGVIDKALPIRGGGVRMTVVDALAFLRDVEITGIWYNLHPLEAMLDIIERAGVPASLIDDASFDPSAAAYLTVSHLVVSHGEIRSGYASLADGSLEPVKALTLLNQLAQLLDGAVLVGEDGLIRFQLFDPTDDPVATWNDDDIGDLEVQELDGNVINSVTVKVGEGVNAKAFYRRDDIPSKQAFAYPGESLRRYSAKLEAGWMDGVAELVQTDMTVNKPKVGGYFTAGGEMVCGMAGTRAATPGPQPADAKLSASRLAYLIVGNDFGYEIISCYRCTVVDSETVTYVAISDDYPLVDLFDEVGPLPVKARYYVHSRGEFATSPMAHTAAASTVEAQVEKSRIADITAGILMVQKRLERWAYGVPIVEFATGLDKHAVQIGDLVVLETEQFFSYGHEDLSDGSITWEVIGKEVDPDEGKITWTLAYATEDDAPEQSYQHRVDVVGSAAGGNKVTADVAGNSILADPFVLNGFDADAAGLSVTVESGRATSGNNVVKMRQDVTLVVVDDVTSWIYLDVSTSGLVLKRSTSEPVGSLGHLLLWQAVAAGGVVTLTDRRNNAGVKGDQIAEGSVGGTQIGEQVIDTEHLGNGVVTTSNLADGVITSAKIAEEAVSYEKLAAEAVGAGKVSTGVVKAIATEQTALAGKKGTRNKTVSQYSKG